MSANEVTVVYALRLMIPVSITVDLGDLTEEHMEDLDGLAADAEIVHAQELGIAVGLGDVQEAVGADSEDFCTALAEAIRKAREAGLLDVEPTEGGAS